MKVAFAVCLILILDAFSFSKSTFRLPMPSILYRKYKELLPNLIINSGFLSITN